jgi:putative ABC transport system permease protein
VRTAGEAAPLVGAVRAELQGIDRHLSVFDIQTLEDRVNESLGPQRAGTIMLGLVGVLALLLASIGIYGVTSYSVSQRTRELGIRIALGAQHADLVRLIVWQGMIVVLIGLSVGIIAALGLTRLLAQLLFGVTAADPVTFAITALLLAGVAMLANYLPARRALRLDPLVALRHQ